MKMIDFWGTSPARTMLRSHPRADENDVVVLERRGHVLVPGQRVEVLLLVVVQGGVVAHPRVDLVRVLEVLLRNRD